VDADGTAEPIGNHESKRMQQSPPRGSPGSAPGRCFPAGAYCDVPTKVAGGKVPDTIGLFDPAELGALSRPAGPDETRAAETGERDFPHGVSLLEPDSDGRLDLDSEDDGTVVDENLPQDCGDLPASDQEDAAAQCRLLNSFATGSDGVHSSREVQFSTEVEVLSVASGLSCGDVHVPDPGEPTSEREERIGPDSSARYGGDGISSFAVDADGTAEPIGEFFPFPNGIGCLFEDCMDKMRAAVAEAGQCESDQVRGLVSAIHDLVDAQVDVGQQSEVLLSAVTLLCDLCVAATTAASKAVHRSKALRERHRCLGREAVDAVQQRDQHIGLLRKQLRERGVQDISPLRLAPPASRSTSATTAVSAAQDPEPDVPGSVFVPGQAHRPVEGSLGGAIGAPQSVAGGCFPDCASMKWSWVLDSCKDVRSEASVDLSASAADCKASRCAVGCSALRYRPYLPLAQCRRVW